MGKYVEFNNSVKYEIEDLVDFNHIESKPMTYEEAKNIFHSLKDATIDSIDFSSDDGTFGGHYEDLTLDRPPEVKMTDDDQFKVDVFTHTKTEMDYRYASINKRFEEMNELKKSIEELQEKLGIKPTETTDTTPLAEVTVKKGDVDPHSVEALTQETTEDETTDTPMTDDTVTEDTTETTTTEDNTQEAGSTSEA